MVIVDEKIGGSDLDIVLQSKIWGGGVGADERGNGEATDGGGDGCGSQGAKS